MIVLEHISKTFGDRPVLRDCSLQIDRGETMVIIGSSGTGKSTLLRTIIGLMEPDEGRVLVDGQDVHRLDRKPLQALRTRMGYLFQSGALINWLTVGENVALPLVENHDLPRDEVDRRIKHCLDLVDLEQQIRAIAEFS